MLINISPTLSPDLLFHLRSMGHGEQLILADANFPSNKYNKNIIRLDGVNIPKAAEAILCLLYTSPSPRDRSLSRMPSSA